jgi:hypothetical protein
MPHMPRPPAISHGVISFLWGLGLGLYIWGGLAAVGVSAATAFIFGAVGGAAIFLFVMVFGEDVPRHAARVRDRIR